MNMALTNLQQLYSVSKDRNITGIFPTPCDIHVMRTCDDVLRAKGSESKGETQPSNSMVFLIK